MSWWYVGVPSPIFSERSEGEQQALTREYALATRDTGACAPVAFRQAASEDAAYVAAKQRWWFLLAGLAVGAGVMHWRMKRERRRA